jgi:hypothetical protein
MVLTILSLVVGYLTLSLSTALLYAPWMGSSHEMTPPFLAFAAICSLGFATLSGWLTALHLHRRTPKAPFAIAAQPSHRHSRYYGRRLATAHPNKSPRRGFLKRSLHFYVQSSMSRPMMRPKSEVFRVNRTA